MLKHEICIICSKPVNVADGRYECSRCGFVFGNESKLWRGVAAKQSAGDFILMSMVVRALGPLFIGWIVAKLRGGAFRMDGRHIALGSDEVRIRGIMRGENLPWADVLSIQPFGDGVDIVSRPARVFSLRGFFADEQDRNKFIDEFMAAQERFRGAREGQMTPERWAAVDEYFAGLLLPPDEALDAALRDGEAAELPAIQVSALQGKMLQLMALAIGARRILEIGTLGGYSTIWLGRALVGTGGKLVTLESEARHADVARGNIARAGLADVVEIRVGRAQETLPRLVDERGGPFDLIFIDADKPGYTEYLAWSLRLARRGTVIIADNVARKGAVIDAESEDANVQGMRRFNEALAAEKRVSATAVQTVGSKRYDGFVLAVVL